MSIIIFIISYIDIIRFLFYHSNTVGIWQDQITRFLHPLKQQAFPGRIGSVNRKGKTRKGKCLWDEKTERADCRTPINQREDSSIPFGFLNNEMKKIAIAIAIAIFAVINCLLIFCDDSQKIGENSPSEEQPKRGDGRRS